MKYLFAFSRACRGNQGMTGRSALRKANWDSSSILSLSASGRPSRRAVPGHWEGDRLGGATATGGSSCEDESASGRNQTEKKSRRRTRFGLANGMTPK